uniref:Uncharacterized protein n=1 Tax=Leersia perrieri TaxID=77586 RepID=A0A0D9WXX4_9ORYZ
MEPMKAATDLALLRPSKCPTARMDQYPTRINSSTRKRKKVKSSLARSSSSRSACSQALPVVFFWVLVYGSSCCSSVYQSVRDRNPGRSRKNKPPLFAGATEPLKVDVWIREVKRKLNTSSLARTSSSRSACSQALPVVFFWVLVYGSSGGSSVYELVSDWNPGRSWVVSGHRT